MKRVQHEINETQNIKKGNTNKVHHEKSGTEKLHHEKSIT